jgi:Tfp pilus assembly protein PilN
MITVIGIAFALAATNVFFYTSYFDKNNKLETELSVYQGKYEQINQLLSDYQKKKGLIENAGVLNKNKLSEYADKIAKTIPDEVVLTEMHFNPKLENDESDDSLVTFQSKQMIIKGNCNKSLIINEWVNVLKMQKFVKDVSLEKFAYSSEGILPNYEIRLITE